MLNYDLILFSCFEYLFWQILMVSGVICNDCAAIILLNTSIISLIGGLYVGLTFKHFCSIWTKSFSKANSYFMLIYGTNSSLFYEIKTLSI